jgi:pantoate--beta-alanine ligase
MELVSTIAEARARLDAARMASRSVGLVPTMGYLHSGHMSLVERSVSDNDFTFVTIFVNPLQFAASEDLSTYPRDLDSDLAQCRAAGVDLVLAPGVDEMYPEEPLTKVTVAQISTAMEGAKRPSHFAGVATVVSKLFNISGPCRAYFGEKDYQQLAVIRRMVRDLSIPVDVVGCPTVREDNGLAMSSRNSYLTSEEREAASVLNRSLTAAVTAIEGGQRDVEAIRSMISGMITDTELVNTPDYVEIVDAESLEPLGVIEGTVRIILAVRVGKPRLLDNVGVSTD